MKNIADSQSLTNLPIDFFLKIGYNMTNLELNSRLVIFLFGDCMNYIKRSIEEIVQRNDKAFKCILVTGARQTGKSTMIKKLFADKKYVSFDDPFIEEQKTRTRL